MTRIVLFGCGNAALTIGVDDKRGQIFSHTKAIDQLGLDLHAIVEPSPTDFAVSFARDRSIPIFKNHLELEAALGSEFSCGIFCMPTFSASTISEILNFLRFERVMLEKPVAYHAAEVTEIFSKLNETGTRCEVNYQRNWDLGYSEIDRWLRSKELITDASFRSSSAIAQSGSHMIELVLRFFPGAKVEYVRALPSKRRVSGLIDEPGAFIYLKQGETNLSVVLDSPVQDEFHFGGTINSIDEQISFDEGCGIIEVAKAAKGNARIGSQISFFERPDQLYEWVSEEWILGAYRSLYQGDFFESRVRRERSVKVVEIIERVMGLV